MVFMLTCEHGVYVIYNPEKYIWHVGAATRGAKGLCGRLNNHINGQSFFTNKYLKPRNLKVRNGSSFQYIVLPIARERMLV